MDISSSNNTSAAELVAPTTQVPKIYSNPASPVLSASESTQHSSPSSIYTNASLLSTPKKNFLDAVMLQTIREKLRTPGGAFELQSLHLDSSLNSAVNVVKDRYLICAKPKHMQQSAYKTPACYRHLVDMNTSSLKCTDVYTGEQFLCKIINEPLHKVQEAYFKLQQEQEGCRSSIYGHLLIRGVTDIVPLNKQRTYLILSPPDQEGVFEDLHSYLREKQRLGETEARALFHQICETVMVCHRNGIILRDLKLKRFFFIDEAR